MIFTKLYKYDSSQENNAYRGEDFSKHILIGDSDVDDLTEILDVVELTLVGLPFGKEFEPTTKFILEKWEEIINNDGTKSMNMWKDWHLAVAQDLVSQPILSDNNYFNHTITFNEASVISQGRLVDNISVTYKLKDVTLDGKSSIDPNAKVVPSIVNVDRTYTENFAVWNNYFDAGFRSANNFVFVFPTWFPEHSPYYHSEQEWRDMPLYMAVPQELEAKDVSVPIPFIEARAGVNGSTNFQRVGLCSMKTTVIERNLATGKETIVKQQTTNPSSSNAYENFWGEYNRYGLRDGIPPKGGLWDTLNIIGGAGLEFNSYPRAVKVASFDTNPTNRTMDFKAKPNCFYTVRFEMLEPPERATNEYTWYQADAYNPSPYPSYYSSGRVSGFLVWIGSSSKFPINNSYPYAELSFYTYVEGTDVRVWLKSAPIENAYNLYQKAQMNTQNTKKINGVNILETPQSYYLEPSDKQELSNTTIVENFYNQKNWWEMQLEIGKYIHAIPKVRFGSDDRFITTWKKLGVPNDNAINFDTPSNKISIYNSKSIENYVSACSSYITNMVQLGGIIEEWVAPKSSSEDYLVYNDVAEIITSKPIIEIVDLEAKCINENSYGAQVGAIRNLTGNGTHGESPNGFVFEENIYRLLPIVENEIAITDYTTSKGFAIYYALGDNKIQGFSYRLPTVNTGDPENDYAIKRILGRVFDVIPTDWKNIKVNDFVFHIKYRTKDTVRSDQTRPDLRKYMLNTKYDRIPQHNQFNNQTDIVVDSVKFGNNIYGKLIRTGNTEYTTTEWVPSLSLLKQSGELYKINGNNYYVARVKNTYFKDHIISEVTYSKDYNQLSEIIGIPSEPRFYEISERSLIEREVPFNDYIVLGTSIKSLNNSQSFIRGQGWNYISNLLLGEEKEFPKYAITVFKNDKDRVYGDVISNEFFYKEICHAVSTYSIENTLTIEWDMEDNFSAGELVRKTEKSIDDTTDTAYNTLEPVQYTDAFGRSDLVDFLIMKDIGDLNATQISGLPNSPIRTRTRNQIIGTSEEIEEIMRLPYIGDYENKYLFGNERMNELGDNVHGLGLIKDNRERISCNYNLQMLTDSDRFVLSAYLWRPEKENLQIALLSQEINKISNETIPETAIIKDRLYPLTQNLDVDTENGIIKIDISSALNNVDLDGVKAIAIISANEINDIVQSGAKYFVMGRNISGLSETEKKSNWFISSYSKDMFELQ